MSDRRETREAMQLDRSAVEQIRGRPLSDHRPANAIPPSTRVAVTADADRHRPWMRDFLGVISPMGAPEPVVHTLAHQNELAYWVDFDEPQRDSDGDGPYRKALIWDRYLRIAET